MYQTNPTLFFIIVGGMVLLIIIINISLFSLVKNKNAEKQSKMLKDAFSTAKSPWGEEEKQLNELSQLVEQIQKPISQSGDSTDKSEIE